jgi:F420-non-reducing hydrogenase iron-sulfur subunit
MDFEPNIVMFCCNWCSYVAADTAGTRKMSYPPSVRIIRMPCSGRVDILHVLSAFVDGADGVLVTGCKLGECHYKEGNYKAKERMEFLKNVLEEIGFGQERLHYAFFSSGEPEAFVREVMQMQERVKRIGPNPKKQ